MQLIDLKSQYQKIKQDVDQRIHAVLDHGAYVNGPEITELEQKLAEFAGAKHCIALSSGTDALLIAMMALGIGPGDEIITTPFTFIATGEMIGLLGATTVFVDIDPDTYNIDPAKIEQAITDKTKAIIPVSLFGQCPDMDAINAIADKHDIPVIEDAAQSYGATYNGKRSCALSKLATTSFFPAKPLGCYGDGGAVFTDDAELDQLIRELRNHGQNAPYQHPRLGINGRLDTIQAAVLLSKLEVFPGELEARQKVADRYAELLGAHVKTPKIADGCQSAYAQYTIEVDNRDAVRAALTEKGIPTGVYYPIPLDRQAPLKSDTPLPNSDAAAKRVLSLPMHPYLSEADQNTVVEAVLAAIGK